MTASDSNSEHAFMSGSDFESDAESDPDSDSAVDSEEVQLQSMAEFYHLLPL